MTKTLLALMATLPFSALAQQVPVDLPNAEAIDAYLKYQQRPAYSAFAISRQGAFGASWSYGLIASAEQAALEECASSQPQSPCMVVSIDGESIQETMDVAELLAHFEEAKGREWPSVEASKVPIQIANNPEQIAAYQAYTPQSGHKAFAAARDGSWGVASAHINDEQARYAALETCAQHSKGGKNCQLIDTNNQALIGRISVRLPEQTSADPTETLANLPAPQSDIRDKERAKPYFKERWEEYQQAVRNKAFAVNRFGAVGMATEHATAMVAEEAALSACENFNNIQFRRQSRTAPCYVIAINNFFDVESIDAVEGELQQ